MIRALLLIITVLALFAGAYYYGDYAGTVTIAVPGYVAETNLPVLTVCMFVFFALTVIALRFLMTLFFFRRKLDKIRAAKLSNYLNKWNTAVLAGDNAAMQKAVNSLPGVFRRKHADSFLLMRARALTENGAYAEAASVYNGLAGLPSYRLAALKGLTDIALAESRYDKAAEHAGKAAEEYDGILWPREVLKKLAIETRDRKNAAYRSEEILHLVKEKDAGRIARDYAAAAINRAYELFRAEERGKAVQLAEKGYKTLPEDTVVTLLYARFLRDTGEQGALQHLIYQRWKEKPSFALGQVFLEAIKDASEKDKIKKTAGLQQRNSEAAVTWYLRAQMYRDIGYVNNAREALKQAQAISPSKEAYLLEAEIEEHLGDNDRFKIEELKKEAANAPAITGRFTCGNCGHTAALPETECGVCKRFDTYEPAGAVA